MDNQSQSQLTQAHVAPRTETEKVLADIWAEVLKLDRVGIYDNFFKLGGHSLLIMKIVEKIHELLKIRLPVWVVFEFPSIASLASHLVTHDGVYLPANAPPEDELEEGII